MSADQALLLKSGIKLFDYDVKIETFEAKLDERVEEALCIRISYSNKETLPEFVDEFNISHKSRTFLLEVVHTLYKCFSREAIESDFIQHNADIGSFEFKFDSEASSKSRVLSVIRTCYLSKTDYTKREAIAKVEDANAQIAQYGKERDRGNTLTVHCINAHIIHDPQWELEVTLNLSPGLYHFHVPDLLELPTTICVRDYVRIRYYYIDKLHDFYHKFGVFRVYLDYIERENNKFIWTKMGFEAGPMENLYSILREIKDDNDAIWGKLFELCVIDVYETDDKRSIAINSDIDSGCAGGYKSSADFITEQSIANFIALSIKYYCLDSQTSATVLTDCDKYLLSIVLPYFDIKGKKDDTYDRVNSRGLNSDKIPLISGLFNRFVNFYSSGDGDDNDYRRKWKMNIDSETLKNELLLHLHRNKPQSISVIKNRWRRKKVAPDALEFELIAVEAHEEDLNDNILQCYDTSFESAWTMWTNKGLKRLYQTSKGFWKILNEFDERPRIPIKHLEAMRALMHKFEQDAQHPPVTVHIYDNGVSTPQSGQYIVNKCKMNAAPKASTTLSVRIVQAFDPEIDKKKKIKSRDSYFLYYKPLGDALSGGTVEWAWYNNDRAKYEDYNVGANVTKQIEATYQGVQEYNFAISDYNRGTKDDGEDERLFIDAQLTELSCGMEKMLRMTYKPFVLRFTFGTAQEPDATHVINMEQVAINLNDGSQFPRNIRRLVVPLIEANKEELQLVDDDVDHRMYCLGKMEIDIDCKSNMIGLRWIFDEYVFLTSVDESKSGYRDVVKNALQLWRWNNLFDQNKTSITPRHAIDFKMKRLKLNEEINNNKYVSININERKDLNYSLPSNYDEIMNQKLHAIDDNMWNVLDALDDDGDDVKCDDDAIRDIYNKYHLKKGFKKRLFTLISLQRVQSIISVMKEQIKTEETLIVAISNEQLLFDSNVCCNTHKTEYSKSLSYLFEATNTIKRIDSKNTIYDIFIDNFAQNVLNRNYLHHFMSYSSQTYKSTLFLFTRARSDNIYISHNGFIRKLCLRVYNEDLYYFLPQFITLQIGDFIKIESFCFPDSGTIIDRNRLKHNNELYYLIRSSHNVYYTLNYYSITNRTAPNLYFAQCRAPLLSSKYAISLWNSNNNKNNDHDPSDKSHPMHIVSLSLLESSKQAISAMEKAFGNDRNLQYKLKQCGVMYLLHRSVENVAESKEVLELLREQKEQGDESLYIDEDVLEQFKNGDETSSNNNLLALVEDLSSRKLISDVIPMDTDMTYNNLNELHLNILLRKETQNNCMYMISIVEKRELIVEIDEKEAKQEETKDDDDDNDNNGDNNEDYSDSNSDDWASFEPEAGGAVPEAGGVSNKRHISISTSFSCRIRYSCRFSRVYPLTQSVEDLMAKYRDDDDTRWSVDENRLLSFFCANSVYNWYDLNNVNILQKLRLVLVCKQSEPRFFKLYKKFEEFIARLNRDRNSNINSDYDSDDWRLISGVEMTVSAVLLSHEIDLNNRMIVTYNPLQSVIITPNSSKDITHPIHIYRSAYSSDLSNFYNNFELSKGKLYNSWMEPPVFPPCVSKLDSAPAPTNIIDTLTELIKFNKKYEIVVIPSSICLNREFLNIYCRAIAPDIDAIKEHRVTFIYGGILYDLIRGQSIAANKLKLNINQSETQLIDDEDRFFLDDLKFLIDKIEQNIVEDCQDCMDPYNNSGSNRLRSLIPRNNRDIMLRWFKIGCGSCFLHEASGRQTEIGPPPSGDYDNDFAHLLKKAMFIYYIDCKIPYDLTYLKGDNLCNLCFSYMIKPCYIIECKNKHKFCRKCIQLWHEMVDNPEWGTLKENHEKNKVRVTSDEKQIQNIILPKYCPMYHECFTPFDSMQNICDCADDDQHELEIPITIYQQLENENEIRYKRLDLLNRYQQLRELQLINDEQELSIPQLREKYKNDPKINIDAILAGYQ